MKKNKTAIRNKWVTVRMNQAEFELLEKNRLRTTEKNNSNYLRKLALQQPVTKLTHNQSMDEATTAIIQLKKEINFIGHNLNQIVHKLHTLDRIPEFRNWAQQYENTRERILTDTTNLLLHAHQILSQWSQK
ncbi:MAG: plasmid mobilization relaxosome protein MobC [Chitinophagaceae bacterium]|nr:plasmid mobilization relaxosome protein MobC [Chitinophagaceae bacterium]MCA6454233.1 plasmid mobilization relaxosome protein MobC [Chitinophagaceae bacterium]MCA6460347.1 plasmid mobilization relaxosome protein MobC [Chitinophagaceae bacterium]MCA6465234.1 plasmid mobilization relaxosome protein MobC [Chitinophagaceae bacterium]